MTAALAFVAVALVVLAPSAAAHHEPDPSAPWDFRNSEPSAFGTAALPPYLEATQGSADLVVPVTLHPEELARPAFRYLVGFNLHTEAVRVTDVALTVGGMAVPVERDETDRSLQPRFIVAGADLPRDGPVELVLTGKAVAGKDGRLHVGVLAIAFDAGWGTVPTRDGGAGQAYAFTLLMSDGHAAAGLSPRFTGQGNAPLAFLPLALVALPTAWGLRAAWRTLHPPAPKPQPAPTSAAVTIPAPTAATTFTPARSPWLVPIPVPPIPRAERASGPSDLRPPGDGLARWPPVPQPANPGRARPPHAHSATPSVTRPERPSARPLPEFTWSEPYVPRTHVAAKRPKQPAPAEPVLASADASVVARPALDFVVLRSGPGGRQAGRSR